MITRSPSDISLIIFIQSFDKIIIYKRSQAWVKKGETNMTAQELIEKLRSYSPDAELGIQTEFGISEIIGLKLCDSKVRYLSVDYGGDYHPPDSLENHEYLQSRNVKSLVMFIVDSTD